MIIIFKIGDLVSRISHNNDVLFRIVSINNEVARLSGVNVRLEADSSLDDLVISSNNENDREIIERNAKEFNFDRANYFYLPGKILHIDGDENYLNRSMKFYESIGIKANGLCLNEKEISLKINDLIKEYRPDIIVITGHDAYYKKKGDKDNINNYQNSGNFVKAIKEARRLERNQDKLIIIAGACQSDYEELIRAGANFASSPRRINIHALDPAIIASSIAFSDKNQSIDIIKLIEKTKYGSDGIGGIITNGTMYVGYPR
ncbi:MAG: sporulation peptidase YabG [Bacilli bacterium]|nr:sporulation peptidase YabG [Bacilli bacterium]